MKLRPCLGVAAAVLGDELRALDEAGECATVNFPKPGERSALEKCTATFTDEVIQCPKKA